MWRRSLPDAAAPPPSGATASRKARNGIPLFEGFLALLIGGLVIGQISRYVSDVLEQAERSAVDATLMNIKSGMRLEAARRILAMQVALPAGGNPVRFLAAPPAGYMAESGLPEPVAPGTWFYRTREDTLFYVPKHHGHLRIENVTKDTVLGWKIVKRSDEAKEPALQTVTPYVWF
ncbi:hypothetical protein VVD49_10085 [Uliginosibacterium sp. H3]|uniref:Type II secretion system protein n=1 Tax=Uliginosibacterium silvisoli TaxID=3114758 RepID=A0ABU6K4A2_9RHOO|nr:hypothetical protein [Uliginosibacterium sp. H3]